MQKISQFRFWSRQIFAAAALLFAAVIAAPAFGGGFAFAQTTSDGRQAAFAVAAQEFNVPLSVLLAVSYNQSRWTPHGTSPSVDGGFGLMNLTTKHVPTVDGRGDPKRPTAQTTTTNHTHYTLDEAAAVLGISVDSLKTSELQNIRGAAAVLATYAKKNNNGKLPANVNDWYSAVAEYSGSISNDNAQSFADDVYQTIREGVALNTSDGQSLRLLATQNIQPNRNAIEQLQLKASPLSEQQARNVDCPRELDCRFVPAGYAANSADPADYGNYDPANRPKDMKINSIVIHDTEGSYQSAINHFINTTSYVSAHYVIRSNDGAITEMVRPSDVAWTAGDWYVNMHSINIEHEGIATDGATWYTEAMYKSSASLVRYLANKYRIPLDREHILGHDNIPTLSPTRMAGQHWDPGPYWDWDHYMELLNGQSTVTSPSTFTKNSKVITISPTFATNQPPVTDCSTGTCVTLPAQGTNFVYLRKEPNESAPFLSDQYLHPDSAPGTTEASDWSNKAVTGQQFAVAGQQGDWTGIYYGGQIGWFYNPKGTPQQTAHATHSKIVTPKAGASSVPVYGGAYPESSAYPATVPDQTLNPLYTMSAGQKYATSGTVPTDYFYDATINFSLPDDHIIVRGQDVYYRITFNHREAYVKATDVTVKSY